MPTLPQKTAADKPAEIDWAAALQVEMRTVVRQAIEHLVGAELGAVLGPPYAPGEARLGYRHGSKVRTITSPVGVVTLTIPRARLQAGTEAATEWQSQSCQPTPGGCGRSTRPSYRPTCAGRTPAGSAAR